MASRFSSIQITKEFKDVLMNEKGKRESFENYVKRMRDIYLKYLKALNEDRGIPGETS